MDDKKILEEILDNTKQVKNAVVKPPKQKKEQTSQEKAQSKFTRVGTKLNERGMQQFTAKMESLGLNQSQYIKSLIDQDLENDFQSVIEFEDQEKKELKDRIKDLEDEIARIKGLKWWEKLFRI